MNIDDLTVKEIKHIQTLLKGSGDSHPYQIGKNYFIRTVTNYYTGKLIKVTAKELVLEDAAWIADTGRFTQAIQEGKLNEVEPFGSDIIIGRGAIIDAAIWKFDLPKVQK